MGNVRDARFDTLKGTLILLVVFGHFFTHEASHSIVSESLANFIYSFHMPLFVFVSGYFTNNQTFVKGGVKLLETYIVFQLFKGLWYHYSHLWLLIMPGPMLWYLVALVFWRLLNVGLDIIGVKVSWKLLLFLVCLSVAVGFIPWVGREFALSRIIVFSPYFFLGVYFQQKQIVDEIIERVNIKLAIAILSLSLLAGVIFAVHSIDIKSLFSGTLSYPQENRWVYALARMLNYFSSILISISFIRIFSFENKILGIIGKDSLKYYMFHGVLLMLIEYFHFPWSPLFAMVYATLVSLGIFIFNRSFLSDFIISPVSFLLARRRAIASR